MPLRAGIVGLGRVGMLFDDDPNRRRVWTHFSTYERLVDRYELVAVCDPDAERRRLAAARRPGVQVFATLDELLDAEQLDVVSLCTPVDAHAAQVQACAGRVRAIVCEKPLSTDLPSAEAAVGACAASGTLLAVNYYKRFEAAVRETARLIDDGALGTLRAATALYSGPLDEVGSHAIDLLQFLLGPLDVQAANGGSALLGFGDGGVAALVAAGRREDLVFELDIIGSEGRARVLDNCARLETSRFAASSNYAGYRELVPVGTLEAEAEPFLALFTELADAFAGGTTTLTADGASALGTQSLLDTIGADVARH